MAMSKALRSLALALNAGLAAGHSLSISDTVSAVQGTVRAHQVEKILPKVCQDIPHYNMEEEAPLWNEMTTHVALVVSAVVGDDMRWLNNFAEIKTYVYAYGYTIFDLGPEPRDNMVFVPLDGTPKTDAGIFQYMIDHYDDLPADVLFVKGAPFWDCAGSVEMVRRALRNSRVFEDPDLKATGMLPGLVPMAGSFFEYNTTAGLVGHWLQLNLGQRASGTSHTIAETKALVKSSFLSACASVLGKPCPETLWVASGGMWAVSKERIHAQTKDEWKRLAALKLPGNTGFEDSLRSSVIEAVWPILFGEKSWAPGSAVLHAMKGASVGCARKTEAIGHICVLGTDWGVYPTWEERRTACDIHEGTFKNENLRDVAVDIRAIQNYERAKTDAFSGYNHVEARMPKKTYTKKDFNPWCAKRHLWTQDFITRLKHLESGKCLDLAPGRIMLKPCAEVTSGMNSQLLRFNFFNNDGYVQIKDLEATTCLSTSMLSAKCNSGADFRAPDNQKFELILATDVQIDGRGYHVRTKGGCLNAADHGGAVTLGSCASSQSVWALADAERTGHYMEKFDFAITKNPQSGILQLRCSMALHGNMQDYPVDLLEPEWKKRGARVQFSVKKLGKGFEIYERSSIDVRPRPSLDCNANNELEFTVGESLWNIVPVSDSFVTFTQGDKYIGFNPDGGHIMCLTGTPGLQDTVFGIAEMDAALL